MIGKAAAAMKRQPGDLPSGGWTRAAGGAARELLMTTHSVALDAGTLSVGRADTLKAALIAAMLGVGLVFLTGFAHTLVLHNGAHDTRHALSFPCH
jgi:cobalt transporter subunit CbtB